MEGSRSSKGVRKEGKEECEGESKSITWFEEAGKIVDDSERARECCREVGRAFEKRKRPGIGGGWEVAM